MNNNVNLGKYLPIGTVVLLRGGKKRLMITGFCSLDENNSSKLYDYSGCLYPEGVIESKNMALFNHNQIEKIFYLGYSDLEEKNFKKELVTEVAKLVQNQGNN